MVGITSPPFLEAQEGGGINIKGYKNVDLVGDRTYTKHMHSSNPSNIGNLPDKKMIGITSPPFEEMVGTDNNPEYWKQIGGIRHSNLIEYGTKEKSYGGDRTSEKAQQKRQEFINSGNIGLINTQGNKGKDLSESYLSAMLQVYQQASQLMPIIVTITKNPTRKGKLRRLDIDTAKLLMMCGYEIVDYHRALLFEEKRQKTLIGTEKKELKGRLSFFKRLSVQKGNVASQWEDVIVAVRKDMLNNISDKIDK